MIYHSYIFLHSRKSLYDLPKPDLVKQQEEFLKHLQHSKEIITNTYATVGLKAKTNILLWLQANKIELIQDKVNEILHADLGKHLKITYTLTGLARPSQYSHQTDQDTNRKGGSYLIIYPFTKTQSWYMLDFEQRKELMKGHISIGRNYPQISQILLYSYGIDDSEFIVSYETDDLLDFQRLVMDLRSDKVREYTLKDTPIFTCIYKSPEEIIKYL
jgi:chlorite dismutase